MTHDFDWVDAFSDRPFGGNGCAVVHDGLDVPVETCTAFVRETSLSECTFVGRSDSADWRVRYFLAGREIPFAGHPTIATVAALLARGLATPPRLTLQTGAGIVPIEVDDQGWITMTQMAPVFGAEVPGSLVAEVMGLRPDDIVGQPQIVSTGLPICVTLLDGQEALRRASLNRDALRRFQAQFGGEAGDAMEPFLVTLQGATEAGATFSRLLLAPPNPPEDSFTGSATGAMAAWLWRNGHLRQPDFVAEQGHWMGRPGQARVSVLGPRGAITGVRVSGQGYVLMQGKVAL